MLVLAAVEMKQGFSREIERQQCEQHQKYARGVAEGVAEAGKRSDALGLDKRGQHRIVKYRGKFVAEFGQNDYRPDGEQRQSALSGGRRKPKRQGSASKQNGIERNPRLARSSGVGDGSQKWSKHRHGQPGIADDVAPQNLAADGIADDVA